MKHQLRSIALTIASLTLTSQLAMADTNLKCSLIGKGELDSGSKIEVTIKNSTQQIVINSSSLKEAEGSFEQIAKKTGDSQYSVPAISDLMDQSDAPKAFISHDLKSITLSLRFTDDDGPQSWLQSKYRCLTAK